MNITMQRIKDFLRPFIPPIFLTINRRRHPPPCSPFEWSGDYADWEAAQRNCAGYDDQRIVERVRNSLLQVKSGRAIAERDSVLLSHIPYRWPVIAALLRIACANSGRLGVMDFGGSLGSSYYHCRDYLSVLAELNWCVVEQPQFVEIGRRDFGDDIRFLGDPRECTAGQRIDAILISGVLQYLPNPHRTLRNLLALGAPHVILDRTAFWTGEPRDRLTVQRSDFGDLQTSYPAWFLHEPALLQVFENAGYRLKVEFEGLDHVNFPQSRYKGFFFSRNDGTSADD